MITPDGRKATGAAAPRHVATVRCLVVDALSPEDLATPARICGHVLDRLDDQPS